MGVDIHEEWHGDRIDLIAAGRRGVRSAAQRLLALSLPKVPVDTSALRSSGRVTGRGSNAAVPAANVEYGTDYAIYQHEALDWHHDEGQAKFLEEPLNTSRVELLGIIAAEIRQGMTP
jgi:hypothetical protein